MMQSRLFIRIYATLLLSLALAALVIASFTAVVQRGPRNSILARSGHFLDVMLPAGLTSDELQIRVMQLSRALDAGLLVYSPDGRLIARADDRRGAGKWSARDLDRPFQQRRVRDHDLISVRLSDGRQVISNATIPGPPGGWRNPVFVIMLIAATIGIAAYPVVRQLTRRLERLRHGVELWGSGHLAERVPETGQDEIAAVGRTFNRAAGQIERLVAGHRSLLANASHELRSPLTRLRMAVELYETDQNDRMKTEIIRNLGELDSLVEEILLASKLDTVSGPELSERVDFLALVAEEAAAESLDVDGQPAFVRGDSRLLRRMVRNLVQNAIRHGAPPVLIRVDLPEKDRVRLTVRDHGAGLAPGEQDRVFDAFYRPAGSSERSGGWGLGLSLVRQIAQHHGGSVRYQTPAEGGASFVVDLPCEA
jgi:two-component system, OmpR family, sensor kinase